jgi:hypothetical protein
MERAKSKPYSSALTTISLLRSKVGLYFGEFSDMIQPGGEMRSQHVLFGKRRSSEEVVCTR